MKYIKEYKTYIKETYSKQDVYSEVLNNLKNRNLTPIAINKMMDTYSDMISNMYEEGFNTTQIVDKVLSYIGHEKDKNYLGFQNPNTSTRNITYM